MNETYAAIAISNTALKAENQILKHALRRYRDDLALYIVENQDLIKSDPLCLLRYGFDLEENDKELFRVRTIDAKCTIGCEGWETRNFLFYSSLSPSTTEKEDWCFDSLSCGNWLGASISMVRHDFLLKWKEQRNKEVPNDQ